MGNNEENKDLTDQQGENTETGQNQNNGNQNGNESGADNSASEKVFTQADVNRMMTREKQQGRAAAYKELGIDPSDTTTVSMFKAFIEAQKTSERKANEAQAQNNAKIVEAENRARIAEAKASALKLGVKPDCVDDVVSLAMSKISDDKDMDAIITDYKNKYPFWFTTEDSSTDSKDSVGKKGTGSSIGAKKGSDSNSGGGYKGIGKRLAASRKTSTPKSSYWK